MLGSGLKPGITGLWKRMCNLAHAQDQLYYQLIQFLVAAAPARQGCHIEGLLPEGSSRLAAVTTCRRRTFVTVVTDPQARYQTLDIGILVEAPHFVLEDQVGAHAAPSERPHAAFIVGAVGLCVEVTRTVIAAILEQLYQEESAFEVLSAKAEVL